MIKLNIEGVPEEIPLNLGVLYYTVWGYLFLAKAAIISRTVRATGMIVIEG